MISPARPLPIEVTEVDVPISDEAADLVAAMLLAVVDEQDRGDAGNDLTGGGGRQGET